jgi:ATP-dependent helicase HrpB
VGYTVRFEQVDSPGTRIRFVTEGILSRRIVQDPELNGISVVVLDEFHERHLVTDLGLALLRRLQKTRRPDLRIVVMSATLDVEPVARYLGSAPVLRSDGVRFPTEVEYENRASDRPIHEKVRAAVHSVLERRGEGDILVFLPGAAEIRQCSEALAPVTATGRLETVALHGDLPPAEQNRAVARSPRRKIILSTNIAESSVTIPGVTTVIDSGLARVAGHSAWSGLQVTAIRKISKASAEQRAGRASRQGAGLVLRLFTRSDFDSRPDFDVPEVKRADLSEAVLTLHGAGVARINELGWYESPPESGIEHAQSLLRQLGALNSHGQLTAVGRRMLAFPLHPRLSRLVIEGEQTGVAAGACLLAALLGERDIRLETRAGLRRGRAGSGFHRSGSSDLLEMAERYSEAEQLGFVASRPQSAGLDPRATDRVSRARRQIERIARDRTRRPESADMDEALRIATLAAFPDRVARRRARGTRTFVLSGGGEALLADSSVVHDAELVVAVDAEERTSGSRRDTTVLLRLVSEIEPEWLAALFPESISETDEPRWNAEAGRVEQVTRTRYDQVVLDEQIRPAPPSAETSRILAAAVLESGVAVFPDADQIPAFEARAALLALHFPGFPPIGSDAVRLAVERAAEGRRSLTELKQLSIADLLLAPLTPRQRELLRKETPEKVLLKSGRSAKVHYEAGKPPWVASRLQDFMGMPETPRICGGRVPLVAHLLAPNGRPVQVTQDLPGFWQKHYPAIRRELQRRYPRHPWPELG